MKNLLGVSVWSIRHNVGPMSLTIRDAEGALREIRVTQGEENIRLGDLPTHVKTEFGVTGLEIPDWFIKQASTTEQEAFAQAISDEEMVLVNVTIDTRSIGTADEAFRREDVEEVKSMIAMAARCGAGSARVNLFQPPIVEEGPKAHYDDLVDALRNLVEFSEELGIQLMIENHCELTDTPEKVVRLLEDVGPRLGFILDTGNIDPIQNSVIEGFMSGEPARYVENAESAFNMIAELLPRADLVHVKTYGLDVDGSPLVYDQERAMGLISRSGYEGPITVECASFEPEKVYPAINYTINQLQS